MKNRDRLLDAKPRKKQISLRLEEKNFRYHGFKEMSIWLRVSIYILAHPYRLIIKLALFMI